MSSDPPARAGNTTIHATSTSPAEWAQHLALLVQTLLRRAAAAGTIEAIPPENRH